MSYFQPINRNEINEIGDLVELGQGASLTHKTHSLGKTTDSLVSLLTPFIEFLC